MRMNFWWLRSGLVCLTAAALLSGQRIYTPPPAQQTPPPAQPAPAPPPKPAQAAPPQGAAPAPAPQTAPATQPGALTDTGALMLDNVSLVEMIDMLARRLHINYILDPGVKGAVTIHTYGEVRQTDLMQLLETVLRVNGAAIVKVGDLYRVVQVKSVAQLPIAPVVNGRSLPDDERMILNLVFLKYATVDEMAKLLDPFLGEGAKESAYAPANLLIILDNARNMKRTMDLIAMFDSDAFAGQRVRLFSVSNGRPSDISRELETVFKAYALSEKSSSVRFVPVDRINTIIAVAPNPGIFTKVEEWLKKLDVTVKAAAGAVDNYVYRLKYGRAETVAIAIMALYSGDPMAIMMLSALAAQNNQMGMNGGGMYGGGMYGAGMYGGGMYGGGMYGGGMYSPYGYGGAGMYGGGYGYGMMPYGSGALSTTVAPSASTTAPASGTGAATTTAGTPDLTGSYLGYGGMYGGRAQQRGPHVIPNPFDNTLLVQGTPQEWEQISRLLEQLDVPPRQVLIEARIYEVDLNGAFAGGVAAYLNSVSNTPSGLSRTLLGSSNGGLSLTAGMLVGNSRQLLGILTAQETTDRARVISEPSVIATDSVAASINVGEDVPTLASQAVSGAQQSGNSLFANTVNTRSSGVTLSLTARVNSSGIVTLMISQDVSKPVAPPASSAIQSPSFSRRTVQTQVTVQDGDTIAIGGIIQESDTQSSAGVPILHRIPVLGGAFGYKNNTRSRTELVIFLTPRVIYDTNQIVEASDELSSRLKRLKRMIKE